MKKFEIICESEEGYAVSYFIRATSKQAAIRELAKRNPDDAAAVLEIHEA